jgi:hypothetical protein
MGVELDFYHDITQANPMRCERPRRRCTECATVSHVEGGTMQRTDESGTAQPAFVQSRICMAAYVIDREYAVFRAAHHDLPIRERPCAHGSDWQFG